MGTPAETRAGTLHLFVIAYLVGLVTGSVASTFGLVLEVLASRLV